MSDAERLAEIARVTGVSVDDLKRLHPRMLDSMDVDPDTGVMTTTYDPDAGILDEVAAWIGRYLSVPSGHYVTTLALWAAHTHAAGAFYVTPRLILDSAEPESGKTRILELLNLLVRSPIFTMNTTIAALYRRLADEQRTILLDETDAIFSPKAAQNHEDLRALLNAGYKRGATVDRCVGDGKKMSVVEFPAYAPAALAGIVGHMPATITTRAITLHMRRRAPDEEIAEFIEEDAIEEAAPLRDALAEWAAGLEPELKGARPTMPAGVRDRTAECWRAILAVADAAGGNWPGKAREACRYFVLNSEPEELSLGVRLLADLRDVFGEADRMSTSDVIDALRGIEDAPWADLYGKPLDPRKLSRMLGKYGVKPKAVRIGDSTPRGYLAEDLADQWRRYLPHMRNTRNERNAPACGVAEVAHVADNGAVADDTQRTRLAAKDGLGVGTCADCGTTMTIIEPGQTTHPTCQETAA